MILGVTGTRKGMTAEQRASFHRLLDELLPVLLLHGACVGADREAVEIAVTWRKLNRRTLDIVALPGRPHAGPPQDDLLSREAIELSDQAEAPQSFFARNREIVRRCKVLAAFPGDDGTGRRLGGTWFTIGHAAAVGRPTITVWPDGTTSGRCEGMTVGSA